jgi:hypothetical protein
LKTNEKNGNIRFAFANAIYLQSFQTNEIGPIRFLGFPQGGICGSSSLPPLCFFRCQQGAQICDLVVGQAGAQGGGQVVGSGQPPPAAR